MVINCLTPQHGKVWKGFEVLPSLQFHSPEFSVIQLGFRYGEDLFSRTW